MRKTILFSLVSAAMLFAANDSTLVAFPATDSATVNVAVDSAAVPADSSVSVAKVDSAKADSQASPVSVEQALLAEPLSKMELVRRGRAKLLSAIQSGDRETALQTIAFLNGKYSENVCPFSLSEKGFAYLQLGIYDSAMTELVKAARQIGPEPKPATTLEERCMSAIRNDRSKIVNDDFYGFFASGMVSYLPEAKEDSLLMEIQSSSVDPFYKDAASAFLPVLNSPYRNPESLTQKQYEAGVAFVQKYPENDDGVWLEKNFLKYYRDRQARLEASRQPQQKLKSSEDIIQKHLYSAGVGFEFLTGIGFLTGELKDEFHHKYWDYYAAIPIQIYRAVLTPFVSFGVAETRKNRQFSNVLWEKNSEILLYEGGLTLGFVAFDSRFVKLEPFVGLATASAVLPDNSDDYYYYANKSNNNYHLLREHVETNNSLAYLAGMTGEFRLLTVYSRYAESPLNSISLRVKYTVSYIDHDFGYKKMNGFSHKVLAGVGFFIW